MIRLEDAGKLQDVLADKFPGQDVRVKIASKNRRELSGYWCWHLGRMAHVHTARRVIERQYPGEAYGEYKGRIAYRRWRWNRVMKEWKEIRSNDFD